MSNVYKRLKEGLNCFSLKMSFGKLKKIYKFEAVSQSLDSCFFCIFSKLQQIVVKRENQFKNFIAAKKMCGRKMRKDLVVRKKRLAQF